VIRRNKSVVPFDRQKITVAMTKAFLAVDGGEVGAESQRIRDLVPKLTDQVVGALIERRPEGAKIYIEDIQDQVELVLMRSGQQRVARAYVLYREERARMRRHDEELDKVGAEERPDELMLTLPDGGQTPIDKDAMRAKLERACRGLEGVDPRLIWEEAYKNLFPGASIADLDSVLLMSARSFIEKEPNYTYAAARILFDQLSRETTGFIAGHRQAYRQAALDFDYQDYFPDYIATGIRHEMLDEELAGFDLARLASAIKPERDHQFTYLSLQTLYDRYFLHVDDHRIEMPQAFFMRVAMGLAIREVDREDKAISFYDTLSSFDFMSSTPTLFNSGTRRSQLSSCFLTTVPDDLHGIYSAIKDNAMLSKFAGGLGNDWTNVRSMGAYIKGTNGKSLGVVPFLKVANDTAVAVNQGGKRKGAVCAYLELWHADIEEFMELRKNTGDDRRRTHDMNTAVWIPDLFMKRLVEDEDWMLLSPDEASDLHDAVGNDFERRYMDYEAKAERGELRVSKKIKAADLWRKLLTMLFETGHPWITFKDSCNLRSPQQHAGVIHSSNLCTEITLNTSEKEVAVCNLGSVNLAAHVTENGVDHEKLRKTIRVCMRMLDNVIDINYYTVPQARNANLRHRPVGLGTMGFQDALYKLKTPYASKAAVEFADESMEAISYYAIEASSDLAAERGAYPSFEGSLWSKGVMPIDSLDILEEHRGGNLDVDRTTRLDWDALRNKVQRDGMRNSNTLAIAPTATISNICGVSQSIEPTYQNLFVKSNLSGDFTVINQYLVDDLKRLGMWDEVMVNDLKYFDGSVSAIDRIPDELKALYATVFEIDASWLIDAGSRRQKWIDQSQSLNLYLDRPSGKALNDMYRLAWTKGLKTTYYLRTMGATHAEKSTVADGALNAVPQAAACRIDDPDCEACQ
jgi:ribonucleoside-diphosphate reductase alpha chain